MIDSYFATSFSKEYVVTRIENSMRRYFGYLDVMDDRRLTKDIYRANMCRNVRRGLSRRLPTRLVMF